MQVLCARQVRIAVAILVAVVFLGGLSIPKGRSLLQGLGTIIPPAHADQGKDQGKDQDQNQNKENDFDHFACYKVTEVDPADANRFVKITNQFTDFNAKKIYVGELVYLCVPTKKQEIQKD